MNIKKIIYLILLIFLLVDFSFAKKTNIKKPTIAEIERVVEYYHSGTKEIMLIDSKLCYRIHKSGSDKGKCKREVEDTLDITKNESIYLWLNFFVPADNMTGVLVQFISNGRTRQTAHIPLINNDFNLKKWIKIPTKRTGKWKIAIIQEISKNKDRNVALIKYKVTDGSKRARLAKIKSLETAVKALPIKEYQKNLTIYKQLLDLDSSNKKYIKKVKFYEDKIKNK